MQARPRRGKGFPVVAPGKCVDFAVKGGENERVGGVRIVTSQVGWLDRLGGLFMQLAHAITELGGTFRFLEVDDAFCNLLRTSRQNLFEKSILDVTHDADRPPNRAMLLRLLASGTSFSIRKRYKRDDGSIVRVENQVARTVSATGGSRLVASVRFVGEIKIETMIEEARTRAQLLHEQTGAIRRMLIGGR